MPRAVVLLLGIPLCAHAQTAPAAQVDVIAARAPLVVAGAELGRRVAPTTRVTAAIAAGGGAADDGAWHPVGRAELGARFTVDPYAERRWAGYGSAALLVTAGTARRGRAAIAAAIGVEGPPRGGWRPAIELGVADGARVRVALRRTGAGGR
jgi:hypothetical protein